MTNQQKYFLDKLQEVNLQYLQETETWLLKVYHMLLHDNLTLDDVCDIGERYGLNIESSYNELMNTFEDNDEEEDV